MSDTTPQPPSDVKFQKVFKDDTVYRVVEFSTEVNEWMLFNEMKEREKSPIKQAEIDSVFLVKYMPLGGYVTFNREGISTLRSFVDMIKARFVITGGTVVVSCVFYGIMSTITEDTFPLVQKTNHLWIVQVI